MTPLPAAARRPWPPSCSAVSASAWNWNFGDPATGNNNVSNLESPQHDFSNTGFYTVTLLVTSQYNCVDSTQSEVTIDPVFTFYIPNAFTPDANDGENHYFYPKGEGWDLSSYLFLVFDRWGARIFETTDNSVYWDGTMKGELAPQDVYVWMVKVKDIYGDNHTFEGKVTLIR